MTARPLGLATCPVLAPALDRSFREFTRNESETHEKKMAATGASTLELVAYLLKMALLRKILPKEKNNRDIVGHVYFFNPSKGTWNDRPIDFIYKWQVCASLFDEYCIMHIVMEVHLLCW